MDEKVLAFVSECAECSSKFMQLIDPDKLYNVSKDEITSALIDYKRLDKESFKIIVEFRKEFIKAMEKDSSLIKHNNAVEEAQRMVVTSASLVRSFYTSSAILMSQESLYEPENKGFFN